MAQRNNEEQTIIDSYFKMAGSGTLYLSYDKEHFYRHPRSYLTVSPQKATMNKEEGFISLLKQNINETKVLAYIPDVIVEQYDFPSMKNVPPLGVKNVDEYLTGELLPYIAAHRIKPIQQQKLRDAVFLSNQGATIKEMLGGKITINPTSYANFMLEQKELQKAYCNNPIHILPIHAIETPKGNLYFSNSEIGRQGLKQFHQMLADNYFSIYSVGGPVKEYTIGFVGWDTNVLIDKSYTKDDEGNRRFRFEDKDFEARPFNASGWNRIHLTTMEPTSGEFLDYIEKTKSKISIYNDEIWQLLDLKEHGFVRSTIESMRGTHAPEFRNILQCVDVCFAFPPKEGKENIFELVEKTQTLADKILKKNYDVRGHRSFSRTLSDLAYDPKVGDIRLSREMRQVLINRHNLYLPRISDAHPGIHFICADFEHEKLRLSETPFPGETFTQRDGIIVKYEAPRQQTVSKKSKKLKIK